MSYNPYIEEEQRRARKEYERAEAKQEISEIGGFCVGTGIKLFVLMFPIVYAIWSAAKWLGNLGAGLGVQ